MIWLCRRAAREGGGVTRSTDGCLPCALEDAAPESVVFRDDRWAAEIPTGLEAPGWFFLRLRRHADGFAGLTDDERAAFGDACARLEAAIRTATGAARVYFMSFGENHTHFHYLVIARGDGVDPSWRGAAIVSHLAELKDPAAALAVAGRVRDAYLPATPTT